MPLSEKPLPSPPIVQIAKTSPMKESRSLIDASEKPLRRSPPGMPHKQEEWPVLSPKKLTGTNSTQAMYHHKKLPDSSAPSERYHKFDSVSPPASLNGLKSGTKLSPSHNIRRKQIPPTKPRDQLDPTRKPANTVKSSMQQVKSDIQGDVTTASGSVESSDPTAPPDLSSSAAAVDKSSYEAASLSHPRQTRISSLRARLSAGHPMNDNPDIKTRVAELTDSTSVNEASSKPTKNSLSIPGETRAQLRGQPAINVLRAKSSEGSMRANRAPAQFVGGSRRPNTHRPISRSSLRSDSLGTGLFPTLQPPKRPPPAVPISSEVLEPAKVVKAEALKTAEPRRSSIPVFRQTVSSMISQAEDGIASVNTKQETDSQVNDTLRNDYDILGNQATEPLLLDYKEETTDKSAEGQHELTTDGNTMPYPSSLQAIEESPRQGYHIKRLSVASPENGPTLKISPDAERLIMGVETNKENGLKNKYFKSNHLHDSFRTSSHRQKTSGTESLADLKTRLQRPSSSQGLSQSTSRFGLISKETREKKVRSAELAYSLSTDHLHQQSAKPKTPLVPKSTDICVVDDPFFDAHSTLDQDQAGVVNPTIPNEHPTSEEEKVVIEEASWISPLVSKHQDPSMGKAVLAVDSAPPMLQNRLSSRSSTNQNFSVAANQVKEAAELDLMRLEEMPKSKENAEKPLPSTPERSRESNNSTSGSFPPRNSSRMTPPDYTLGGSAKPSPTWPLEGGNPTSKEFSHRHNQLGASKGHASSPVDISHVAGSKRDSTARESAKSQGSISKGMLSNIRGLFHKRSSDSEPYSMRSSKKYKPSTSIVTIGSPFLPISEIHPIHRPTLASSNRSVVNGQKPTQLDTNINTPATPSFASPLPSEISATTTLAMQLLESARTERSSPKKERALELGTIMVEAITQARDAEKAMEEAKQAARRAEVAYALCKKAVGDVSRRVLEWRDEFSE